MAIIKPSANITWQINNQVFLFHSKYVPFNKNMVLHSCDIFLVLRDEGLEHCKKELCTDKISNN